MMQKTKIDWGIPGLWTWNPVTGCKRNCSYCYARRIHNRFNKTPFSEITLHKSRLEDPIKNKKPCTIFVGSMSDFCYWPDEWKDIVINICAECPQHEFMFLSKGNNPYYGKYFSNNCVLGITRTFEPFERDTINNFLSHHNRGFLSIEPLLGKCHYDTVFNSFKIEKVIVGAMTGPGAIKPQKDWIERIKSVVPEKKLHWKPNIRPYL